MPIPAIKSLAEKSGKSVKEVEELFKKAKQKAYDTYNKDSGDYFPYAIGILKNMLGLKETSAVTIKKLNTNKKVSPKSVTKPAVKPKKKKTLSIWDIPNSWLLNMSGEAASSAIRNVIYHEHSKSLLVNWHSKSGNDENFYLYKEVPLKVFVALSKPGVSKGQFIAKYVKGKFESEQV